MNEGTLKLFSLLLLSIFARITCGASGNSPPPAVLLNGCLLGSGTESTISVNEFLRDSEMVLLYSGNDAKWRSAFFAARPKARHNNTNTGTTDEPTN